jgi:hypothetical protein
MLRGMTSSGSLALALGGTLSAVAALAHLACIAIGAPAYRIMGAGEHMARAAERGSLEPTLVTLAITVVLALWALLAFSGAGLLPKVPLLRWALLAITAVYLARALAFPLLRPLFSGNSSTFWLVSSGLCLLLGAVHLYGLWRSWEHLG